MTSLIKQLSLSLQMIKYPFLKLIKPPFLPEDKLHFLKITTSVHLQNIFVYCLYRKIKKISGQRKKCREIKTTLFWSIYSGRWGMKFKLQLPIDWDIQNRQSMSSACHQSRTLLKVSKTIYFLRLEINVISSFYKCSGFFLNIENIILQKDV